MADIPSTSGIESSENFSMDVDDVDLLDGGSESNQLISPVERAFHIDLVLKNIADNLNFCDLKNFRLINMTANVVASSILLREDLPVVNFKYNTQLKEYLSDRHQSVDDFINVIEKSKIFPCSSFSFVKGNVVCKKLQSLFKMIGPQIKTLSIIGRPCWDDKDKKDENEQKDFADLLLNKLPKLETLHIGGFNYDWIHKDDNGVVHDHRLTLPTLKFLFCINRGWNMYEDGLEMLASAPLLQEIHGYNNRYFDHLGSIISIDAIKSYNHLSYDYWCDDDVVFENLTKFANAGPKLNAFKFHLYIPYYSFAEEYAALMKILESSQNTLKDLRFNIDAYLFDFPVFTSLKNLTIDVICNGNGDLSDEFKNLTNKEPKAADASCFPNVETITLVYDCCGYEHWYSPGLVGTFFKVTTLNIIHLNDPCYEMGEMFPKVTKLLIEWKTYSNYLDWITEMFKFVEEIEFVGLTSEMDKKCTCDDEYMWNDEDIEVDEEIKSCCCIKRFIAGILNLKCLKKLKFLYDCTKPPQNDNLFDAIKLHAIDLLPELQVTLAYDHQSEFAARQERILHHPRIKFVHEVYKATPSESICKP